MDTKPNWTDQGPAVIRIKPEGYDSDWQEIFTGWEYDAETRVATVKDLRLNRGDGAYFDVVIVNDSVVLPDGKVLKFAQPLLFEHGKKKSSGDTDKNGDVVAVFRRESKTGRWMILTEEENVYRDEQTIVKIIRAVRSSVDNVAQAIKKTVIPTGWIYLNPRRIGGPPAQTHYAIAPWSPQQADRMVDVREYVTKSPDSIGKSAVLNALVHMGGAGSDERAVALEIFEQMLPPLPAKTGK